MAAAVAAMESTLVRIRSMKSCFDRTIHEGRDEQAGQDRHDQKEGENSRPKAH